MGHQTIDIMLPFYGRSDHFYAAVKSVLAQADESWRLVIIDDANPDPDPGRWASQLGDKRIEYRRHTVNQGINRTFQECLDLSRSEWVTVFGCDDVMRPRYVARIRELASAYAGAAIIHPGTAVIDADGAPSRNIVDAAKALYRPHGPRPVLLDGERLAVSLTRGNWMNFPAIAWHGPTARSTGFRADFHVVQDLALAIDICERGGSLILDDEVVFDYRRHGASVSSWRAADGSRFVEEAEYFNDLKRAFDRRGWRRAARAARFHLSSRINALTRVPGSVRARDTAGTRALVRHAFGS